jgi:hypothetical protein
LIVLLLCAADAAPVSEVLVDVSSDSCSEYGKPEEVV